MRRKAGRCVTGVMTAAMLLVFAAPAFPCTVVRMPTGSEIVADAELIVRARAEGHAAAHGIRDPAFTATEWQVRFHIIEVLKGTVDGDEVVFNGELEEKDDWNDRPVPYDFIRPGGRKGNCHALGYRTGAEYLLLLRRSEASSTAFAHWSPYWSALTPLNEQVRGGDDAWVRWVRDEVRRQGAKPQPQSAPGTDAVMSVDAGERYVIVNTHARPSAATGLVFRRSDLTPVTRLNGFFLEEMPGPLVRYLVSADDAGAHDPHLMVFNPATGVSTRVFPDAPGTPPDTAARSFRGIAHTADGRRIAFVADYGPGRPGRSGFGNTETIVVCALVNQDEWTCDERDVRAFAGEAGVDLAWNIYRRLADESLHAIVQAALR